MESLLYSESDYQENEEKMELWMQFNLSIPDWLKKDRHISQPELFLKALKMEFWQKYFWNAP